MLKSFAGGRLFGATWGSGVPGALALHGWRRTHRDFDAVFAGAERAAMAVDLFGFGATPAPPAAWGSADYARSLLPLFEEEGVLGDRIVLVGHSFGGCVALHLATLVPDRVERLVLAAVPLLHRRDRRAKPAAAFRMVRRLHRLGIVSDARMEAARAKHGSADYRAAHGVMRSVFVGRLAEQYDEQIQAVSCPVHLVWGDEDTEVPLEVASRAQMMFARADLEVLPGVGHLVPTEAPGALRAAVFARNPHGVGDGPAGPGPDAEGAGPISHTSGNGR